MSSSASYDAGSDLSSHDGSVLSEDVALSPHRRRTSSVHTAAAQAIVGRRRTLATPPPPPPPLLTPSARSVHYAPLSPTPSTRVRPLSSARRPPSASAVRPLPIAEAAAVTGVAPPGADRLKHLQLHMEQLQQLYAQEIHKEELAAREAFVQSMCTASITLWRYVSSRGRFYTAVKALLSQYLPASNAKLIQVETHGRDVSEGGDTGLSLVLADGRVVEVSTKTADAMGIAGHAAMAASQVTASQWRKLQQTATAALAIEEEEEGNDEDDEVESSASSLAASSTADASTHLWLDRHADCVMPSTNDHLVLLLSLDRVYQNAGFHAEIDLTIKKKELLGPSGTQLLVVVLRDSQKRPIGVVEALISTKKPLQVDFLDAFSSLLAAALEARRSICRPVAVADGIRIEIVKNVSDNDRELQLEDKTGRTITTEIAPGTLMVVTGATPHSINPENDMPILEAAQEAMTTLYSQTKEWELLAAFHSRSAQAHDAFWSDVVEILTTFNDHKPRASHRVEFRAALSRLNEYMDGVASLHVLFEDESHEEYATHACADAQVLSVEAQYGAMHRAILKGEAFESTPCAVAEPVGFSVDGKARAAVLLLVGTPHDELGVSQARTRTLPLVIKALELLICSEKTSLLTTEKETECMALQCAIKQQKQTQHDSNAIRHLSESLVSVRSLDQVVTIVNAFVEGAGGSGLLGRMTLFVAETEASSIDNSGDSPSLRCVWTMLGDSTEPERIILYDRESITSPRKCNQRRGGMAAFVLEAGAPLSYTPHHDAYDRTAREKLRSHANPTDNERCVFFATPLQDQHESGILGVLEVAFTSQDQHDAFFHSSFALEIAKAVRCFFQLHVWLAQREDGHAQSALQATTKQAQRWKRWTQFVADWCDASTLVDLETWRARIITAIQELIPSADHVNVLFADSADEAALMDRVELELRGSNNASSPSLNVLHHDILRSVVSFPLEKNQRQSGDEAGSTGRGLLVLAATEAGAFHGADRRFGVMVAGLLAVWWRGHRLSEEAETQEATLQALLADLENELAVEHKLQRCLRRDLFQRRVVVCLSRVIDSIGVLAVESEAASIHRALRAVTDECTKESGELIEGKTAPQRPFWLAVLESSKSEEWLLWCVGEGHGASVFAAERGGVLDAMLRTQQLREYTPPFPDQAMNLMQTIVGSSDEFFVQGSRLFVAPLVSKAPQHRVLVVLAGSGGDEDDEGNGGIVDASFVRDLAEGFNRVLAWQVSHQALQETKGELSERAGKCEQLRASIDKTTSTHGLWVASWRSVVNEVLVVGPKCQDESAITALETRLLGVVASSAQQVLAAVEVKIVAHAQDHNVSQEWLLSNERLQLLNQQHRRLDHGDDHGEAILQDWEWWGATTSGVFLATTKRGSSSYDSSVGECITFAVRCDRGEKKTKGPEENAEFQCRVRQYLVLVDVVCSIVDLHRRRCREAVLAASQIQSIDEKAAVIEDLHSSLKTQRHVNSVVQQLLDVASLDVEEPSIGSLTASLSRVVGAIPDFRLWFCDTKTNTLWATHEDGSRRVRNVDDSTWRPHPHQATITVDGEHVALLEFTGEEVSVSATEPVSSLKLITSTLQSCFSYRNSLQVIQDLQRCMEADRSANNEFQQRQEMRNAGLVSHWRHVDGLLRPLTSDQLENAVDWHAVLHQIEAGVTSSVNEIEDVRVAIVDLDATRRQVTEVRGSLASVPTEAAHEVYQHVASALEVWSSAGHVTFEKHLEGETMRQVCADLFPKSSATEVHGIVAIAVRVDCGSPVASGSNWCYVISTVLVKLVDSEASARQRITRALEMDSRLVATAVMSWRRQEAARLRAVEAEAVSIATAEKFETAQQWTQFTQRAMDECQLLMATTVDTVAASSSTTDSEGLKTRAELFAQSVCGCDALELFAVTSGSPTQQRQLIPLVSSVEESSVSMRMLEKLLHQDVSEPGAIVRSSPDGCGCRVVSLLQQGESVLGAVVLHWRSQSQPLPNATLELVDSVAVPWLTTLVRLLAFSETQRTARGADSISIASLAEDKAALELEGLELKNHLTQIEQRNTSLQDSCQLMGDVFRCVEKTVAALLAAKDVADVWQTLVKELTAMNGVEGVQLHEKSDISTTARLVASTLSNADDETLARATRESAGRSGIVAVCLNTGVAQETRVAFQSEFKRVRCVGVGEGHHKCLVVVHDRHHGVHHAVTEMTDRCVELVVRLGASRVSELGRTQLQEAAAAALEETTQDLTTQLQERTEQLTREQRKSDFAMALHGSLTDDLVANEVWKPIERPVSSASLPTAKLVVQWRFLQDTAQRRLRAALGEEGSVQLYGVVAAATDDSFVFSLPSTKDRMDGEKKGFYCVALRQLQQQKREWRVMAKCIAKRSRSAVDAKTRNGLGAETARHARTVFFPILKHSSPANHEEESNNEDDAASDQADGGSVVVGVLAVKSKGLVKNDSELDGFGRLLQEFADALASRVELIARLVDQKQQRGKPTSRSQTQPHPRSITSVHMNKSHASRSAYQGELTAGVSDHGVEAAAVPSRWPSGDCVDACEDTPYNSTGVAPAAVAATRDGTQDIGSNQHEAAQGEDVDSEDERQAERVRHRVDAAVASAILAFSFRVQSLASDVESVSALRSLVARELKSVWIKSGDQRKQALDSVEVFFVVDGAVSDRLDGETTSPGITPRWLQEVAQRSRGEAGFRLWKFNARRWVATMAAPTSTTQLLVAFTGSTELSRVFDATDELHHLPSLLRVLYFQVGRVLEAHAHVKAMDEKKKLVDEQVAQQLAQVEEREAEAKRRVRREEELNELTMRLLQAPDDRAVVQMGLHAMKQWLQCGQVAFHTASSSTGPHAHTVDDDGGAGSHHGVASMETILRVRVWTGYPEARGDNPEGGRELLGTLVARLSDSERQALETSDHADRKAWLLQLLHRLADAVGAAWEHLRQRRQLQESARHLVAASKEIETLQQQVEELGDASERLNTRVDELERDVTGKEAVEEHNHRLQREVDELRSALETCEEDQRAKAVQLKRYETQLVEVNCQLEQSIRVETQLMQLEQVHAAAQAHGARLERKLLKQKLQLKQLVAELTSRRDKDERDQAELVELRRQVAVLMEKQQHSGRMDATSVATAVMQAQAQAHQTQAETKHEQQQRVQSAVQRRLLRQMQLQQQTQKQKQLDLAQELKQLAAMEVREMQRRSVEQRERDVQDQWQRIRSQSPTKTVKGAEAAAVAKVHSVRSHSATVTRTGSEAGVVSKLRPPSVVVPVAARRGNEPAAPS